MARISQDDFSGQSDASGNKTVEIDAHGQDTIEVPSNDFIADSEMSREGQDLVLEAPDGSTLIVNNYFTAEPAPTIESPDGSILTPNLVNSFLNSPAQFAQASTMADVSPIGAVEESKGDATVIRADGTSEPITLGTPIYEGDTIETSGDGAVNIVFIDETSMAVSENARLSVDDYQFDPSTESGETNLSVLRGVFVYTSGLIGRDDPDDVMIDTPVGSIGIRGTIIAGKIQPGGESEITVVEGAIVVMNGASEFTLSQQYESVRLGGFNDNMEHLGVKPADDVGKTYGSVKDVLPKLFSSINDTASEESKNNETNQSQEDDAQASEEQPADDTQEQNTEEVIDDLSAQEALEEFSDILAQAGEEPAEVDPAKSNTSGKNSADSKALAERDSNTDNPLFLRGSKDASDSGRFKLTSSPVFENSEAGDVVARVSHSNLPAGTSFAISGPGAGNYVGTMNGNVFEVTLNTTVGAVGSSLGSFTVEATPPGGTTVSLTYSPVVADAAIHLNSDGGLQNYEFETATTTPALKTFDLNNDGSNDTITGNPNATSGGAPQAGQVLINGSTIIENPTPESGDHFGAGFDSIGDFNGDGITDFAVGAPENNNGGYGGEGKISVYSGTEANPFTEFRDTDGGGNGFGHKLSGIGDINGDGFSDILVRTAGTNANEAYVLFGSDTPASNVETGGLSGAEGFRIDAGGHDIVAGGSVGDINGDGIDDFAISLDNGSDINTYVAYGSDSGLSNMDLAYLENPDNALKLKHTGAGGQSYNVTGVGDVNGDGFDDFQLGVVGGHEFVVHGEAERNSDIVTDGSAADGNSSDGIIRATVDGQSLVGDADFSDNGMTFGLRMKGGGSDNTFSIGNEFFASIDGGKGYDTIRAGTPLDFSNINFEQIDQIECIQFGATGITITLTAENIFNMLKTSDTGELRIDGDGHPTSQLQIDATTPSVGSLQDQIVDALNEVGSGATYVGSNSGYDHYQVGDYNLYIDQGIDTTTVV